MVLKTKGKTSLEHRVASTGITWRWIYVINKKETIRVENILDQWNSHSKSKIHILLICILMSQLPMSDSEAFLRKDYSFPVTCVMCLLWNYIQMSLRFTLSKIMILIMPESSGFLMEWPLILTRIKMFYIHTYHCRYMCPCLWIPLLSGIH